MSASTSKQSHFILAGLPVNEFAQQGPDGGKQQEHLLLVGTTQRLRRHERDRRHCDASRDPEKAVKQNDGTITLAKGEVTCHSHAITVTSEKIEHYIDTTASGPVFYLRVKEPVVLSHQEHAPGDLGAG
jgi:hypothetical protein